MLLILSAVAAEPTFDATAAFDSFEAAMREGYAYLDRTDVDVDAWLSRARAAAVTAPDAPTFRATVNRALVALTDPHLLLVPVADDAANVWPTSGDLAVAWSGDGYRIADVRQGSAADAAVLRPGLTLTAVDGAPIADAVDAWLAPFAAAPTDAQRSYVATLLANGRRDAPRRLTVVDATGPRDLTLPNPREHARVIADRPPISTQRTGDVAVIRFENSLGQDETIAAFDAAISAHLDARAIVIDLRNTPSGGNTDVARAVIGHFLADARPYQMHEIPAVARATTVPRRFVEYALPRDPQFRGPIAVLGGRWTGSMGEGLVIGLQAAAGARTFAADLGDLRGALHTLPVPEAEATLELGLEALFHVDGTPREAWVADVPLASADRGPTGGDPALNAALSWLNARKRR